MGAALQGTPERERLGAAWTPQLGPQAHAIAATLFPELLFGGAKYGGKSDYLLGDFLQDVPTYRENWHGILYRQEGPQLEELIRRSHMIYPRVGARWGEQKKTWHFPEGSTLKMRQIETVRDIGKYWGHSYTWIGFDELGNWATDEVYRQCGLANLRWGAADVPTKRIRGSANPGGPGHQWVKDYFIDPDQGGYKPIYDEDTKQWRVFIPSKITDNRLGLVHDPGYADRLKGMGSPELVRAWLLGDWNIVAGAYFSEFGAQHVLQPFTIPPHWTRFMAMDPGSGDPFSIGWYAVSDGTYTYGDGESEFRIPRGALVKYREWYGADIKRKGIKLHIEAIGEGIKEREREQVLYRVSGVDLFDHRNGPSRSERLINQGLIFRRADVTREAGWDELRRRLVGKDGKPLLYFFSTCAHTIRTLPTLQHDPHNLEDVAEGEDHAADETRYACMSRPLITDTPPKPQPIKIKRPTLKELFEHRDSMRGRRR